MSTPRRLAWRQSGYSFANGNCLDVAPCGGPVHLSDSKNPGGPVRLRRAAVPSGTFNCPACGSATRDPKLIAIGCCPGCLRPTGLCPVGREISLTGIDHDLGDLCAAFGVVLWEFAGVGRRLVCLPHDQALDDHARYVWLRRHRVAW